MRKNNSNMMINNKLIDDLIERGIKVNDDKELRKRKAEKERELNAEIRKAIDYKNNKSKVEAFANMPKDSIELTLDYARKNWEPQEMPMINKAISAVLNFDTTEKGLYMYSKNSRTGKTALMSATARAIYNTNNKTIWFGSEELFLAMVKETYRDEAELTEEQVIKFIASHDAVFIDELGQNDTDWSIKTLKRLLDAILNSGAMLFITSNYSLDDLGEKLLINQNKPMSRTVQQVQARIHELTEILQFGEKSYFKTKS